MSRMCDLCGKKPVFGHSVSYSKRRTAHVFLPNTRSIIFLKDNKPEKVTTCMKCLKKAKKEGKVVRKVARVEKVVQVAKVPRVPQEEMKVIKVKKKITK